MNSKYVPFSTKDSYFALSYMTKEVWGRKVPKVGEGVYLRFLSGEAFKQPVLFFDIGDIQSEEFLPQVLRYTSPNSSLEFTFENPYCIRVRGAGNLRVKNFNEEDILIKLDNDFYILNFPLASLQIKMKIINGRYSLEHFWDGIESDYSFVFEGNFELSFCEHGHARSDKSFDALVEERKEDFESYLKPFGNVEGRAKEAVYLLWSSTVEPRGNLKREAILMSKNWMNALWSWDNVFNAVALSSYHPKLALDQIFAIFDHQKENGKLPDYINDSISYWNFVKPPIYGWGVSKILERIYIDKSDLSDLYDGISFLTNWWLEYMDYDGDGIPQYNHGNDSGWDNSTVFLHHPPVESPDLSAFLVVQMETLERISKMLGLSKEKYWKEKRENLLKNMLNHFYHNGRLFPVVSGTHQLIESKSLLPYISLVAAKHLPDDIKNNMKKDLKSFETDFGLATEIIESEYYDPDGYWRGPIWAPSTLLSYDFLKNLQETELAKKVKNGFLKMVEKEGFAENFDAINGKARSDRAHTWTASVYLILKGCDGFEGDNES